MTGNLPGSVTTGKRDFPEVPEEGGDPPWLGSEVPGLEGASAVSLPAVGWLVDLFSV